MNAPRIAVLIPCHNEAPSIAKVVTDFRAALPTADIWVFDNLSTDATRELALAAGARIASVARKGKGHVVRQMFADIEADVYVLVDGDDTYDASRAPELVRAVIAENCDMAVGVRSEDAGDSYRAGHRFGNRLFTGFLNWIFDQRANDVLSGYRAFSRRFVKSFPALSRGFEIETELSAHAFRLHLSAREIPTSYGSRPENSHSKLRTWSDGLRILLTMLRLFSTERPLLFYSLVSGTLAAVSVALGLPVVLEWIETGLVPRLPTAVLAAALMQLSALCLLCGLVLTAISRSRLETRRLAYLSCAMPLRLSPEETADRGASHRDSA